MEDQKIHQVKRTWSIYDHLPGNSVTILKRFWFKLGFSQEFGTLFRYEIDMLLLRLWCAVSLKHHRQVRQLRHRSRLRVQLGCGNALKSGWINLDCYPPLPRPDCEILTLDLRQKLPFVNNSVEAMYSEHFIEHVPLGLVRHLLLPECFRILMPGGYIRVGVPDGEWWIGEYQLKKGDSEHHFTERSSDWLTWMMEINRVARDSSHFYLYDYETLAALLSEIGFIELRKSYANDSNIPCFIGIDQTDEWRMRTTVYIEGRRPE